MADSRGGKALPPLRRIAQIPTIPFELEALGPIPKSWVRYLQPHFQRRLFDASFEISFGVIMLKNSLKSNSLSETGSSPTGSVSAATGRDGGGRVKHDSRGNAVWDWGVATGVFARFKATDLLNMLENPTLALEGECTVSAVGDWAGDPYNRR